MVKWVRNLLLTAGALVIGGVGAYAMSTTRLKKELEVVIEVLIHQVTIKGLVLRAYVTLKNPTGGTITVKHPFVKLIHGDTTLVSSNPVNKNYVIPQFGMVIVKDPPIEIEVSFVQLGFQAPSLLKSYRENGKIKLTALVISTINNSIPFSEPKDITIGGGGNSDEA